MDYNPSGSSVHGILRARMLEWVAISFSRGPSQPRDQIRSFVGQADFLPSKPPGKPCLVAHKFTPVATFNLRGLSHTFDLQEVSL